MINLIRVSYSIGSAFQHFVNFVVEGCGRFFGLVFPVSAVEPACRVKRVGRLLALSFFGVEAHRIAESFVGGFLQRSPIRLLSPVRRFLPGAECVELIKSRIGDYRGIL